MPLLHRWHKASRTFPVLWQWSMTILAALPQMAQLPDRSSLSLSRDSPYRDAVDASEAHGLQIEAYPFGLLRSTANLSRGCQALHL